MDSRVKDIECTLINKVCLWFEKMEPEELLFIEATPDNPRADLNHNFDYEKIGENKFLFHIDAGMTLYPYAKIATRSTFEINYDGKLDDLFVPDMMEAMNKAAFGVCRDGMKQYCAGNGIKLATELTLPEPAIANFSQGMIDQYMNSRRHDDAANHRMRELDFLNFTSGTDTKRLLNGTFMITDEVLFLNPAFDRRHNQEIFKVPISVYHTLKLKCIRIKQEGVPLNLYCSTLFLICLDCSLQLLIGDHLDVLAPALTKQGLSEVTRSEYIKYGSQFFKSVNDSLKKTKSHIANLDERPDWNSLIRRK